MSTVVKVHLQKFWILLLRWSVSTAAKVHLQKFWILLLHWSVSLAAKVHLQKFWILLPHWGDVFDAWNGVLSDHMAFRWPLNGPGMAFWGILANERVKKDFP